MAQGDGETTLNKFNGSRISKNASAEPLGSVHSTGCHAVGHKTTNSGSSFERLENVILLLRTSLQLKVVSMSAIPRRQR